MANYQILLSFKCSNHKADLKRIEMRAEDPLLVTFICSKCHHDHPNRGELRISQDLVLKCRRGCKGKVKGTAKLTEARYIKLGPCYDDKASLFVKLQCTNLVPVGYQPATDWNVYWGRRGERVTIPLNGGIFYGREESTVQLTGSTIQNV